MPTSPREILETAKHLARVEGGEAFTRSAISRAYYAALLEVEATFEKATRIGEESSHSVIIGGALTYGRGANPGREAATFVAKLLPRMRRERNNADYHMQLNIGRAEAVAAISRAEQILEKCAEVVGRRSKANLM